MKIIGPTTMGEQMRAWERRIASLERSLGPLRRDPTYPSDQRPDPTETTVGSRIFDIDLGKPLWCNSAGVWVDATGTAA